jgi:hypothetical protein
MPEDPVDHHVRCRDAADDDPGYQADHRLRAFIRTRGLASWRRRLDVNAGFAISTLFALISHYINVRSRRKFGLQTRLGDCNWAVFGLQ